MLEIQTQPRDQKANPDQLRNEDAIPAVYYGAGKDAVSVTVPRMEFIKVYKEAGEATIITLKTADGDVDALVQDIQLDPVSHKLLHVDFKVIEAGKAITVSVPLQVVGEAPAEKNNLGVLSQPLSEIEVEVLPKDLPSHINVDISGINTLEDHIFVKDLSIPAGATVLTDAEVLVATVSAIKEEVEEEATEEIDFSAIEVEKKGKAEDEEAETPAE